MLSRLAADTLVIVHLAFIIFVVAGGFLAWRWRWLAWAHLPAAVWGAVIELFRWTCPLTPLEKHFRTLAGGAGYEGGFIEHYIIPIVYPAGLTPAMQVALGILVVALNGVAYFGYFKRRGAIRR
ncbi:MAG: DUF2784 family protein [Gemmatimonadales bacterium]|nr:DUF2784 family protein [Gemmatimonadales bacterium]NIN12889.1 DUF2784 family protein [Gemmatimonadales bacterium]NIR00176.1 DUF2784 family protein [Gemmatimonadales bacterium]NIS65969.1 DUF2784 family protein [Gemmatimonadales bacterium]